MTERDLTAEVIKLTKQGNFPSCAIEVKLCKGTSIPFSALAEHQKEALLHVKRGGLAFKIPDMGYQNPFDIFVLNRAYAYVCVIFYKPRVLKEAIFIDIDDWGHGERKSLTLEQARDIGAAYSL